MKKKIALWMSLVTSLLFIVAMAGTAQSGASPAAVVSVNPSSVVVESPGIGLNFTVSVKIENVTDMGAFEIMIWWDRTLVNATDWKNLTIPTWDNPYWLGPGLNNTYNATHGRLWRGCANLPAIAVSGDFTVLNITFTALSLGGPSPISVYYPGFQYPAKLSTTGGDPIECTGDDGEVEVIPEFPVGLIMPLLMATTLVAAVLGKKAWLRKRRNSFVAK